MRIKGSRWSDRDMVFVTNLLMSGVGPTEAATKLANRAKSTIIDARNLIYRINCKLKLFPVSDRCRVWTDEELALLEPMVKSEEQIAERSVEDIASQCGRLPRAVRAKIYSLRRNQKNYPVTTLAGRSPPVRDLEERIHYYRERAEKELLLFDESPFREESQNESD